MFQTKGMYYQPSALNKALSKMISVILYFSDKSTNRVSWKQENVTLIAFTMNDANVSNIFRQTDVLHQFCLFCNAF